MEVEKVKINRVGAILYFVGFLIMLVSGIVILIKTNSTDRMEIIGWALLGVSGFYLYSKFDGLVYSKIRKDPKDIKKLDKKRVGVLVKYFIILVASSQVINMVTFIYLLETDLPNLAIFLLYFPIAIGWSTLIIVFGILLFLWKNDFELRKIVDKLRNIKTKRKPKIKVSRSHKK